MESNYKKELVKIISADIRTENRKNKANLTITMDFLLENKETEHITIDFIYSNLRFFNFINILMHVVEVKRWSQLAGKRVFVHYDRNAIYRIGNVKDDRLFLDFSSFFHVDC
ncbi:MAG TPA: hypothetical protein PLX88_03410 [Syntrophorhabdaceae bacterium]|jgi:hypothetical protein|nr:hypothetical protein [Syntrophorhabdaceae bacterium]MDI9562165.1 hypothetical protein [Pseudomonadota bacterium]OQC50038.1 MAG: hypothetical protein BWX58_00587 [Deltaproteobacteria bacterium ADurb.Bin026]HNZ58227.1 hypothetical protein [Syntrophorhabdaceae bacterium]HPH41222.1 hypothetical protein [Syntrophorhabdaceae bacterium]